MMSVAIVDSATFQLVARPSAASVSPITWLPESPMKTAAGFRGRKLNGRKPATASASASETTSRRSSSWIQTASMAKKTAATTARLPARPSMLSRRLKAFVIATSHKQAEGGGGDAVLDDLHADPRREHDAGRRELPGELHRRRQRADVVDQAEGEHDRRAACDARELPRRLDRAGEQARADASQEAEEDADAAERRRLVLVPAVAGRGGDEAAAEAVAQQRPDRQCGDREGDDGSDGAHGENGSDALLSSCVAVLSGTEYAVSVTPTLLELLRCPVCRGSLDDEGATLRCRGCGAVFPVEDGMPRMLDDRLPGIEAKRREIEGWPAMARSQGWYEPDDETDSHLPYLNRDLGWDDKNWRATEHSFSLLLDRYVRPGMRVLEVGAAKAWASQHLVPLGCEYVATDILADPVIGLGRGSVLRGAGRRVRTRPGRRRAPALRLGGVRRDVLRGRAPPRARPGGDGARDVARHRKGGWVCALNEGTRALGAAADVPDQEEEKGFGINEHVHTLYAYLWAFSRSGLVVRRVEQAEGYGELAGRRIAGRLLRVPGVGRSAATFFSQTCHGYSGVSVYARKGRP